MQRVLIADASVDCQIILAQALGQNYQVECCAEGNRVLQLLKEYQPDVLILDLMLPGIDGLGVLQAAQEAELLPATLVTGRFFSDFLMDALSRYPVEYVLCKPYNLGCMAERVRALSAISKPRRLQPTRAEDLVTNTLLSLGAIPSQSGFVYLREGIQLKARDPRVQLTKYLYPAIGERYGVNGAAVEKAIRTTIATAYRRRDDALWRIYFSCAAGGQVVRPTSGQFITRLAEALLQQQRRQAG